MMKQQRVILASASPRRKEILSMIIDEFSIVKSEKEESYPESMPLVNVPVYLAKQKAQDVFAQNTDAIIIAADTIVISDNKILGKPKNKEEVIEMISGLSGKKHMVVSGVCIKSADKMISFKEKTYVTFNVLTDDEIKQYSLLTSVYDKAGAYAIQQDAGKFISKINGDYYNVVGLPLSKLYLKLKNFNISNLSHIK